MPLFVPSILVVSFFPFLFLRIVDVTLFVVDHVLSERFVLFCFSCATCWWIECVLGGRWAGYARACVLLFCFWLRAGCLRPVALIFVPRFALICRDRFVCIICTVSGFGF